MQKIIERRVIHHIDYVEWCKKEGLPRDSISRQVFKQWEQSIPDLQDIIDDIVADRLEKAYEHLGQYVVRESVYRPLGEFKC